MEIKKTFSGEIINSTFKSAAAGDRIRNIIGQIDTDIDWFGAESVFSKYNFSIGKQVVDHNNTGYHQVIFNTSNVVPTGNDNSPRTVSERFWRRVA